MEQHLISEDIEEKIRKATKSAKNDAKELIKLAEKIGKPHKKQNHDKIKEYQKSFDEHLKELTQTCGELNELNENRIGFEKTTTKRFFRSRLSFRISRIRKERDANPQAEVARSDYDEHSQSFKRPHRSVEDRPKYGSTRTSSDELVHDRENEIKQLKGQTVDFQITTEGLYKENKHLKNQLESLKSENYRYIQQIDGLKAELDDTLTRLSAIASSKLRDDNPNVVDLSDQNRPSKIAEQLSELYDNEWTNAYDVLEKDKNDRLCCETLLKHVTDVYKECKKLTAIDDLYKRVQQCILLPAGFDYRQANRKVVLSDLLKQQIKELRKTQAKSALPEVSQVIMKKLRDGKQDTAEMDEYLKKCIEICWLMVVQDPPLAFSCGPTTMFDTAMFRSYTKRGRHVEFVVWPALLVQEGGPLLSKGIAQGYNKESSTTSEKSKYSSHV